jgi:hypothetical protein
MSAQRFGVIGLCLLVAVSAFAADPGAPLNVRATDVPEDKAGTTLRVTWEAPSEADRPSRKALVAYQVFVAEADGPLEWRMNLQDPEAAQTDISDLKPWPWPKYRVQVAAVYGPEDIRSDQLLDEDGTISDERAVVARSDAAGPVRPKGQWFNSNYIAILVLTVLICAIVIATIYTTRGRAEDVYIRPIAGLEAVNDAIGRATEMGKPIVYVSGLSGIGSISTIASMLILGHLSRRSAAYETEIIVPCNDPLVMTTEREIVRQAYTEAGKPDAYQPDNIFFLTSSQFGYVAAVDGIMIREEPAACFYMGYFYAEALILAETGNETGAIQIAGTDADTQLPFFITACDYTLMGEELYAASAYLSRQPLLVAQLRGQDIAKTIIAALVIAGVAAATYAAVATGVLAQAAQTFVQWFAS